MTFQLFLVLMVHWTYIILKFISTFSKHLQTTLKLLILGNSKVYFKEMFMNVLPYKVLS